MDPDTFFVAFPLGFIVGVLLTVIVVRLSENRPPPDLWEES